MAIISPEVTFPFYVCAGLVNFVNSILLILYPDIKHAFLLWGSVNTFIFIFVRLHVVLFMFSNIDWELNYTYSIIAAAAVSYPMSGQGLGVLASHCSTRLWAIS